VAELVRRMMRAAGRELPIESKPDPLRRPGSTEVLESLIGKGKQLMGSTKNGYTKTLLAIAASVSKVTTDTIEAALRAIPVRDVTDWIKEKLGISLQAQRQRALPSPSIGTKMG